MVPLDAVDDLPAVLAAVAAVVLLSATQDIATDGVAVRMTVGGGRAQANGIQAAGTAVGNVLGGGGVLIVYDTLGWATALAVLAALSLLPTWLVLRYSEGPGPGSQGTLRDGFARLRTVLRPPGAKRWALVVLPLSFGGTAAAYGMVTPALVDAGWSLTAIGLVNTVLAGAVATAVALGTGRLIARHGSRRVLVWTLLLSLLATTGLTPLMFGLTDPVGTPVAVSLYLAGHAAASVVTSMVNMSWSRPESAGTDYTTLTSIGIVASFALVGGVVAGAGSVGYPTMLAVCAALVTLALLAQRLLPLPAEPAAAVASVAGPAR